MPGKPIDKSRPAIKNPNGTTSTEETITIEEDGKHYVLPTIVGGIRRPEDAAIALWEKGKNKDVGEFSSAEEANDYAKKRSNEIGKVRGFKAGGRVKSASARADGCAIRGKTRA